MPVTVVGLDEPQCIGEFVGPFIGECDPEDIICKVEWSVLSAPSGIDINDVLISSPFNVETMINFPAIGKYTLDFKCYVEDPCPNNINFSAGKSLTIICFGFNGLICGQALGFEFGDVVTMTNTNTGVSSTNAIGPSGIFCAASAPFVDGDVIEAVVQGENIDGCPTSASTTFQVNELIECQPIDLVCSGHGFAPTFIGCCQVCGGVASLFGYTFGDIVSTTINGTVYSAPIIPDPNPDPLFNGQPIWCLDFSDEDCELIDGQPVILSMTNGTCTTIFPYVHY